MNEQYDRKQVESVLKRAGASEEQLHEILDKIDFPIGVSELRALLLPLGITHDALIDRMGGSP